MIAYLRGKVYDLQSDSVVVDVNGVGYELSVTTETLTQILIGQEVELLVHTVMREDALNLFGFMSVTEKKMFLSLIKVNGIGPKMAITILSGAPIRRVVEMIESGDVKGLTTLPKVGKKTAEQMILTLKGQLILSEDRQTQLRLPVKSEIASALINLGFRGQDVDRVVNDLSDQVDVETGVRVALQIITKG